MVDKGFGVGQQLQDGVPLRGGGNSGVCRWRPMLKVCDEHAAPACPGCTKHTGVRHCCSQHHAGARGCTLRAASQPSHRGRLLGIGFAGGGPLSQGGQGLQARRRVMGVPPMIGRDLGGQVLPLCHDTQRGRAWDRAGCRPALTP